MGRRLSAWVILRFIKCESTVISEKLSRQKCSSWCVSDYVLVRRRQYRATIPFVVIYDRNIPTIFLGYVWPALKTGLRNCERRLLLPCMSVHRLWYRCIIDCPKRSLIVQNEFQNGRVTSIFCCISYQKGNYSFITFTYRYTQSTKHRYVYLRTVTRRVNIMISTDATNTPKCGHFLRFNTLPHESYTGHSAKSGQYQHPLSSAACSLWPRIHERRNSKLWNR